jgi:hypothetical protein
LPPVWASSALLEPRSSLAREPERDRDFLERFDPDFVERLDPEPPLLLFLLSAIRDHPVHHLLYGETTLIPHPLPMQTRSPPVSRSSSWPA